jgi:AhpD family alkylhydroperoxidase
VSGKERKVEVAGELRMKPRIEYGKVASEGRNAMFGLESYVRQCGLEVLLLELVRLRASQINGCAYCVDMHTKDARAEGETEQRLYALVAWEETPFFTERERAALAWTEAVTKVGEGHVADSVFAQARRYFSEKELVDLTLAVVAINGWNRLAISFRTVPGTYSPGQRNVGKSNADAEVSRKEIGQGVHG